MRREIHLYAFNNGNPDKVNPGSWKIEFKVVNLTEVASVSGAIKILTASIIVALTLLINYWLNKFKSHIHLFYFAFASKFDNSSYILSNFYNLAFVTLSWEDFCIVVLTPLLINDYSFKLDRYRSLI